MIIAVIDDGICQQEIKTPVEVHYTGKKQSSEFVQTDAGSHGTVCAKIIEKYAPPEKFIDIPFLGDDDADLEDMCRALECCLELNADVINLSCGSAFYDSASEVYARLLEVCRKLYKKGVKIYAAQNNAGYLTVPAQFPYVTSVEQYDRDGMSTHELYRRSDLYTESVHSIVTGGKREKTLKCNSYACAYATACESAGRSYLFKKRRFSHTVNAYLPLYKSVQRAPGIFSLYLDDEPDEKGRVYFGSIPEKEKQYIRQNKLRSLVLKNDEKTVTFIKECARFFQDEEIPYIYIRHGEGAMESAEKLCSMFLGNEYKCSVISDDMNDVFRGALYSPAECTEEFARLMAFYNGCNVMVIVSDGDGVKYADDIYIQVRQDGYSMSAGGVERKISEAGELFQAILSCYE